MMIKENSNTTNKMELSPYMLSFNDYYMKIIGINDNNLTNSWGWFIDIELNSEPKQKSISKYNCYNPLKLYAMDKSESMRSMRSMNNLHDTSMIFEMEEETTTNRNISNLNKTFLRCICLLIVITIYYLTVMINL